MKKIGIAIPVVFLFLTIYIYTRHNQSVIKGVSSDNLEKIQTINKQLIQRLKKREELNKIQLDYYTLKEKIVENQPTERLKINIKCEKADPYILCHELNRFFNDKKADIFQISEESKQILFEAGRNKQKAIEILINW